MRRVLLIATTGETKVVDIDERPIEARYGSDEDAQKDPYQVASRLLDVEEIEKVKLGGNRPNLYEQDICMFVDGIGHYRRGLVTNQFATIRLYPGYIVGNVVLMKIEQIGPDLFIKDCDWDEVEL